MSVDFKEFERRMGKALDHLQEEFGAVRAGRANAKVLDRITVEYYGSETPLNGVATISSPDARTLVIQPWDTKLLKDIQKAIQVSDLGINPQNDGRVIRLSFPQLLIHIGQHYPAAFPAVYLCYALADSVCRTCDYDSLILHCLSSFSDWYPLHDFSLTNFQQAK